MKDETNPPITLILRWVTTVEALVLGATSLGLFFLPDLARPIWAWTVGPFNALFLGTIYLSSFLRL